MKKHAFLFCSIPIGIAFFGIMFTLIRTFYYKEFPLLQEYIFPILLGTFFGTGIGLWRIQTNKQNEKLEKIAFELSIAVTELQRKNKKLIDTQAKLKLSEKMESMGILAGGVAHDLNNILSATINYPELMLDKIPKDSPLRPYLIKTKQSGEKAAAIIQDLLTLARRGVQHNEIIDMKHTIQQYLTSPEFNWLRSFHPDVVIETDFKDDLSPVKGSPIHLYKTVMNLVSNAAEAISNGGLIRISIESKYVDYYIRNYEKTVEGNYTILTVSDTGQGIEKDDLERIFEPFFTKKKMGRSGTGLGMAVVWGTVRDHDGYIEIQSKLGEGTQIIIYLPATTESPTLKEEEVFMIDKRMGKGKLVLIVDDVKEQREMATEIVQTLGYQAVSVPSGEAAIEYLKYKSADVMLLDINMAPGINGVETYKGVVKHKPDIKVISTSGYFKPENIQELKNLDISEFLHKPYKIESISKALRRELTP